MDEDITRYGGYERRMVSCKYRKTENPRHGQLRFKRHTCMVMIILPNIKILLSYEKRELKKYRGECCNNHIECRFKSVGTCSCSEKNVNSDIPSMLYSPTLQCCSSSSSERISLCCSKKYKHFMLSFSHGAN